MDQFQASFTGNVTETHTLVHLLVVGISGASAIGTAAV